MKRKYELKERARRREQTRQRIVEAAVGLHTSVGPARTTISAIAERAGVERHTVYAHFPDEDMLFQACSAHWAAAHPAPDPAALVAIDDPARRLRQGLRELYAWFETVEGDLELFARDAASVPPDVRRESTAPLTAVADAVADAWPRRRAVRAAIGHALEFGTWRSLVRTHGLSRTQAVDLMVAFVRSSVGA